MRIVLSQETGTLFVEVVGWRLPDHQQRSTEVHGGKEDKPVVPNPGRKVDDVLKSWEEWRYAPGCEYYSEWPRSESVASDLVEIKQGTGKEASSEEPKGKEAEIYEEPAERVSHYGAERREEDSDGTGPQGKVSWGHKLSQSREKQEEQYHVCAHECHLAREDGGGEDNGTKQHQSFLLVLTVVASKLQCFLYG